MEYQVAQNKDIPIAVKSFQHSCNGNIFEACIELAKICEFSDKRENKEIDTACAETITETNYGAGVSHCEFYMNVDGIEKDSEKASFFFDKACQSGFDKACQDLLTLQHSVKKAKLHAEKIKKQSSH